MWINVRWVLAMPHKHLPNLPIFYWPFAHIAVSPCILSCAYLFSNVVEPFVANVAAAANGRAVIPSINVLRRTPSSACFFSKILFQRVMEFFNHIFAEGGQSFSDTYQRLSTLDPINVLLVRESAHTSRCCHSLFSGLWVSFHSWIILQHIISTV